MLRPPARLPPQGRLDPARPLAALVWAPASAVHPHLMPGLLHRTVRMQAALASS